MEKEKFNQVVLIAIIISLLICVIVFILYTLVNKDETMVDKVQVRFNQIYSSDYKLKFIDNDYFIGSYEENKINVIIDRNGKEIYYGGEEIYYDNIFQNKNGDYIIYNNLDNKLTVYLFNGSEVKLLYQIDDISYVRPLIYKDNNSKYIIGFINMIDDDLVIYNLDNTGTTIVDNVSLVGDAIVDSIYYIYNENYLVVRNNDGKMGVINLAGDVIIDYKYQNIINTFDNSFIVLKKDKYGIIDDKGKTIIQNKYKAIYCFGDYYILVNAKNKMALLDGEYNNLTDFKMDYNSLVDFDLRSSNNSVDLKRINGKILIVNNNLEDINKTEYDKHDLYIVNTNGKIQDTIKEIGYGFSDVIYTYNKDYEINVYDNYFEVIFQYKLDNVLRINNIVLVSSSIYQIEYLDLNNKICYIYVNIEGDEVKYDLGHVLISKELYNVYLNNNDNYSIDIYDKELNMIDSIQGEYVDFFNNYVIVDNAIYQIVES